MLCGLTISTLWYARAHFAWRPTPHLPSPLAATCTAAIHNSVLVGGVRVRMAKWEQTLIEFGAEPAPERLKACPDPMPVMLYVLRCMGLCRHCASFSSRTISSFLNSSGAPLRAPPGSAWSNLRRLKSPSWMNWFKASVSERRSGSGCLVGLHEASTCACCLRCTPSEQKPPASVRQRGVIEGLMSSREAPVVSAGRGPRAALKAVGLKHMSAAQRDTWLEDSRLDAILGNCRLSIPSFRSGVRCYLAFVGAPMLRHGGDVCVCVTSWFRAQMRCDQLVASIFHLISMCCSRGLQIFDLKVSFVIIYYITQCCVVLCV